jgi:hypothetical protein
VEARVARRGLVAEACPDERILKTRELAPTTRP